MAENNGSAKAIIDIGRGGRARKGSKYNHQDLLLRGFYDHPASTAKEIAAEVYDWKYERYADAPKRAGDLASQKLGYLLQLENRRCRRSGKEAHTFSLTDRGIEYLRKSGLLSAVSVAVAQAYVAQDVPASQPDFSELKGLL